MALDRHDLYERTVQSPGRVVEFLRAIHGRDPRALGEDFSGTAAVSRAWVRLVPGGSAVAVDLDLSLLERASGPEGIRGLEVVRGDVREAGGAARSPCDAIFVGNFSIGEIRERGDLVRYLERSRRRLNAGGIFVCDTYGGPSSLRVGAVERSHWIEGGDRIRYVWEQREVDRETGRVVNAMHFRIEREGEIVEALEDAFVYRWRLWSVPELRDALQEAGFGCTEVRTGLYGDRGASLDPAEGFVACVVGRVDGAGDPGLGGRFAAGPPI